MDRYRSEVLEYRLMDEADLLQVQNSAQKYAAAALDGGHIAREQVEIATQAYEVCALFSALGDLPDHNHISLAWEHPPVGNIHFSPRRRQHAL
jgi:hypothetical protein